MGVFNLAADIFERTWPAPTKPDPTEAPAYLAREGASAVTRLLSLHLTGNLGAHLTEYESAMLTAAMEVLDELHDRLEPTP